MQNDERDPSDPRPPDEAPEPATVDEPGAEPTPPESEAPATEWPSEDLAGRDHPAEIEETPLAAPQPSEPWPSERTSEPWPDERSASGQDEMEAPVQPTAHEPPPSEVEAYPTAAPGGEAASTAPAHSVPASGAAVGESTLCPRCGTENRPGLAFCRTCGQRLMAAGTAATVERPSPPEGTQACPRCGTHNRAGAGFCQNCGANLRTVAGGYVPPAVQPEPVAARAEAGGTAVLGPVILLLGVVGIVTAYLLPFVHGTGSLLDRAFGTAGYGIAFWEGYGGVPEALADQAYVGLAAASPLVALLLIVLAAAGIARGTPAIVQRVGLVIALLWAVGIAIGFLAVELVGNLGGDLVGLLSSLSAAGIIFFLSALIVVIGTLTRFARS